MNIKHIFVFAICSATANGFYTEEMPTEEKEYYDELVKSWKMMDIKDHPIQLDKAGDVVIKVLVSPGARRNELYVANMDRLGIKVAALPLKGKANEELISYMSKILKVRKSALKIISEENTWMMSVALKCGTLTLNQVIRKLEEEFDGSAMIGEPGYLKLNKHNSEIRT